MEVKLELKETADPIYHCDSINVYQKGDLLCILDSNGIVYKYPIENIWRVSHPYTSEKQE